MTSSRGRKWRHRKSVGGDVIVRAVLLVLTLLLFPLRTLATAPTRLPDVDQPPAELSGKSVR